jgi:hypothetical protein
MVRHGAPSKLLRRQMLYPTELRDLSPATYIIGAPRIGECRWIGRAPPPGKASRALQDSRFTRC